MNGDSIKNYFTLKKLSLLYDHYAFIDVPDYYADQLFIRHQVTVRFRYEYKHPEQPYIIIFCKVRKRDRKRFLSALAELNDKMILCGYSGYEAFCTNFIAQINSGSEALRKKRGRSNEACSAGKAERTCSKRAS